MNSIRLSDQTCIIVVEIEHEEGQIETGIVVDRVSEVLDVGRVLCSTEIAQVAAAPVSEGSARLTRPGGKKSKNEFNNDQAPLMRTVWFLTLALAASAPTGPPLPLHIIESDR